MKAWHLCGIGLGIRRWRVLAPVRVAFPTSRQLLDLFVSGNAGSCEFTCRKVARLAVFGLITELVVERGESVSGQQAGLHRCV